MLEEQLREFTADSSLRTCDIQSVHVEHYVLSSDALRKNPIAALCESLRLGITRGAFSSHMRKM